MKKTFKLYCEKNKIDPKHTGHSNEKVQEKLRKDRKITYKPAR